MTETPQDLKLRTKALRVIRTYSERSAIELFAELGWTTVSAMEEVFGARGTLSREPPDKPVFALLPALAFAKT